MKRRFRRRWWVLAGALVLAADIAPLLDPAGPQPVSVAVPVPVEASREVARQGPQPVAAPASRQTAQPTPGPKVLRAQLEPAFDLALQQLRAGSNKQAIASFEALIRRAAAVPEFHVNLGYALLGEQRLADARDAFTHAIELHPWQANAYYGLAVAADGLGDPRAAIGAMRTFLHLTPPQQPHVVRARAAIWEWQASLDAAAPAGSAAASRVASADSTGKSVAAPESASAPVSVAESLRETVHGLASDP